MTLRDEFGNIDIYLFDQLLRGRVAAGMPVFDAGCGAGRNLVYLLRQGYDVCGNDADPNAIAEVRAMAAALAPNGTHDFRLEPIERTSFPDAHADAVMASAVLHFADDTAHFSRMVLELWRVLAPGGLLFARLGQAPAGIQPTRGLFSFNDEAGACPRCQGLSVEDCLDLDLLVADPGKSLREGALRVSTPNGYLMYSQVTLAVLDAVLQAHGEIRKACVWGGRVAGPPMHSAGNYPFGKKH